MRTWLALPAPYRFLLEVGAALAIVAYGLLLADRFPRYDGFGRGLAVLASLVVACVPPKYCFWIRYLMRGLVE